jgi:hypothetical protein
MCETMLASRKMYDDFKTRVSINCGLEGDLLHLTIIEAIAGWQLDHMGRCSICQDEVTGGLKQGRGLL